MNVAERSKQWEVLSQNSQKYWYWYWEHYCIDIIGIGYIFAKALLLVGYNDDSFHKYCYHPCIQSTA